MGRTGALGTVAEGGVGMLPWQFVFLLLLPNPMHGEIVRTNAQSFFVSDDGSYLVAEGSWTLTSARATIEIPKVNSFRIECSKAKKSCREFVAKLIRPADEPNQIVKESALFLMVREFDISVWNDRQIVAIAQSRAADIFLTISLKTRAGERVSKETEARGALGARATADTWIFK
jgi:hypothetical protein